MFHGIIYKNFCSHKIRAGSQHPVVMRDGIVKNSLITHVSKPASYA